MSRSSAGVGGAARKHDFDDNYGVVTRPIFAVSSLTHDSAPTPLLATRSLERTLQTYRPSSGKSVIAGRPLGLDYPINGYVALDVARRFKPDVIFCDLGSPGVTGFEIAEQIRRDPELKDTRLIAVTGYPQFEERAKQVGFDQVYSKPLDPKVLHDLFGDTKDGSVR